MLGGIVLHPPRTPQGLQFFFRKLLRHKPDANTMCEKMKEDRTLEVGEKRGETTGALQQRQPPESVEREWKVDSFKHHLLTKTGRRENPSGPLLGSTGIIWRILPSNHRAWFRWWLLACRPELPPMRLTRSWWHLPRRLCWPWVCHRWLPDKPGCLPHR